MSILVVGTVAFDSIETPFGSAERVLGGSASYFAVAASFFSPVKIVGIIGQDFPEEYLTIFSGRGVDLEGLRREKGETFHWRGRYHEDLNVRDTVELHLNVLSGFVPHLPESYRDAEYVFLGNIDPDMQMEVLRQLRRMRLVACDTMDHWILNSGVALRKVLRKIETLVINDSEARLLSGEHNIVRAARAILKMGPKVVLIKRGEYGVLQFSDSSIFGTPAYLLEEVESHWAELQPRSGLSPEALREVLRILREHFHEHAPAEYEARFEEARSLLAGRDPDDVPYVALALALGADGVWSEDRDLTTREGVRVYRTVEVLKGR